jgi:hypothetical protein
MRNRDTQPIAFGVLDKKIFVAATLGSFLKKEYKPCEI